MVRAMRNLLLLALHHAALAQIALCDAARADQVIAIASELKAEGDGAPDWIELMPAGKDIMPADGRDGWKNPGADKVIAAASLPFVIDYDHATDRSVEQGASSRAAGWIEKLENRDGAVWGKVEWTEPGRKAVAAREYRFISPVFTYTKTGRVIGTLLRAALVNNPALPQLTALNSNQKETALDELKKIAAALGLPETATLEEVLAKITAVTGNGQALTSAQKRLGDIATAAGLTATADKLSDSEVVAICTKLKAPGTGDKTVDDLNKEVARLSALVNGQTAEQAVDKAIAAGKVTPAQRDWAVGYASRDAAGFKEFVNKAPAILADGQRAPKQGAEGELDAEDKALCAKLGIKEEDFKENLTARKEGQ